MVSGQRGVHAGDLRLMDRALSPGERLLDAGCRSAILAISFDGILANIHTGVLVPLLESFAGALRSGGWMILSGITEEEWRGVSRSAALLGFGLEDVDEEGGWRTGWFRRRVD